MHESINLFTWIKFLFSKHAGGALNLLCLARKIVGEKITKPRSIWRRRLGWLEAGAKGTGGMTGVGGVSCSIHIHAPLSSLV